MVPSLLRGRGVRPVAKQFCDETVGPGSAAAAGTHGEPSTTRLGELLVEQKLITPGQLEESLRRQREAPRWVSSAISAMPARSRRRSIKW